MLTCKRHTAAEFKNLSQEQCEAMAKYLTGRNQAVARAAAEISILEETIYRLTGMDSVDAVVKAFGRDLISGITVVDE